MNKILNKLNINETYTKKVSLPKFDQVKSNIFPMSGYNFMADLLHLPQTKEKYNYLFVIVDLWSNAFDIEPLKSKTSQEVLEAMKKIFNRKYIQKPKASLRTDNGTEFQGVFHKWLYDNDILHREAEPHRHKQLANVENLNKTLGRLFNGYMNKKEEETGKIYKNWSDIIIFVRDELNKIRKLKDGDPFDKDFIKESINVVPKYKIGDVVYRKVERPMNALGHYQNTTNFRVGDYRWDIKNPRKINHILFYPNNVRYILNQFPHVSYTENELMPAETKEETYTIKKIIDKRKNKKQIEYLIWWNGYLKKDATWEPQKELLKDGLRNMIDDYEKTLLKQK